VFEVQALDVPSLELRKKLASAQRESKVIDLRRAPIAYDTEQPAVGSSESDVRGKKGDIEYELDDFDSRLKRRL
jgi:hypothetical protein